jgi:hypothetical protein
MTARQLQASVPGIQVAIVPLDATVLEGFKRIFCLTSGNLVMQGKEGISVTYPMTSGQSLEFSPTKIMTATTGTYVGHR